MKEQNKKEFKWKTKEEDCKDGNHCFDCKCSCGEVLNIEEFLREYEFQVLSAQKKQLREEVENLRIYPVFGRLTGHVETVISKEEVLNLLK